MKEHSVEYMSMDHYMKSEKMKKKSAKIAEMGMTTCATPGKTNEEVQDREQEMRKGNMFFY